MINRVHDDSSKVATRSCNAGNINSSKQSIVTSM